MRRAALIAAIFLLFFITTAHAAQKIDGLDHIGAVELEHAKHFSIDRYSNDITLLSTSDGRRYLVVPKGVEAPKLDGAIVLRDPVENIYIAATSAMSFFRALDKMGSVSLSGTREDGWAIEEAAEAMRRGEMIFAGRYSAPDYELMLARRCGLAIESMMMGHAPEVLEKLDEIGIPTLVDLSSSERDPLGRVEWIKFYGALLGAEDRADELFAKQRDEALAGETPQQRSTVAFFYVTRAGTVAVRSSSDYLPAMIEMAGGRYIFEDLGDPNSSRSGINMSMEAFTAAAREADFIIYNEAVDAPLSSMEDLIEKSELFAGFKAVRDGNVWCTGKYLHQATDILGSMTGDIRMMLNGEADESKFTFLRKLKR